MSQLPSISSQSFSHSSRLPSCTQSCTLLSHLLSVSFSFLLQFLVKMGAIFASFLRVDKRKRVHRTRTLPTNRDRQLAVAVVDFTVTDELFCSYKLQLPPPIIFNSKQEQYKLLAGLSWKYNFKLAGQIHCKNPELLPLSVVLATQILSIMVIRV